MLLEKERSHDACLGTTAAYGTTVGPGNGAFPLLHALVLARLHVLDALQGHLAVAAFRTLGRLVHALCLELAPRSPDSTVLVLGSVVGMASRSGPTRIRHGCLCLLLPVTEGETEKIVYGMGGQQEKTGM